MVKETRLYLKIIPIIDNLSVLSKICDFKSTFMKLSDIKTVKSFLELHVKKVKKNMRV